MGDVDALLLEARVALATLHSPSTSPDLAKKADQALAQIKGQLTPVSCIQISRVLLSPLLRPTENSAAISISEVHFGFHLLVDLLFRANQPWATFSDEVRAAVREIAELLFVTVSAVDARDVRLHSFPPIIVENTVDLLAGVAIREWPQRWPDFLDKLLADPRRAETACHVLRVISEDINEYPDQIESSRRQELMHVMALTLPQTLRFLTAAVDTFHQQKKCNSLNSAMQTLQSFMIWASLHHVFDSGVPKACLVLLHEAEVRDAALAALGALVKRQFDQPGQKPDSNTNKKHAASQPEKETAFGVEVFSGVMKFVANSSVLKVATFSPFPFIDAFAQLMGHSCMKVSSDIDVEEHAFHIRFFTVLSDLGSLNFSSTFLLSRRTGDRRLSQDEKQISEAYLELMLCASASPSPSLRSAVLPFFTSSLGFIQKQHEQPVPLQGLKRFFVVGYIEASCISLLSLGKGENPIAAKFAEIDYSDDERLQKDLHENFIARTISSVGVAAKICPDVACVTTLNRLLQLLMASIRKDVQANRSKIDSRKFAEDPSAIVAPTGSQHNWLFGRLPLISVKVWGSCLASTAMVTEAIIAGAGSSKLAYDQTEIYQLMLKCFEHSISITEQKLLPIKSALLRIYTPLYAKEPRKLEQCFSILVQQGADAAGTSASRFRACLALSTLCRRLGRAGLKSLGTYIKPMCEHAAQSLASSNFETVNKTLLLEASISLILVLDDVMQQATFVEALIRPILEILEPNALRALLLNPVKLFAFVCDEINAKALAKISEAFQILEVVTHQVVRPNARTLGPITLPNALSRSIAPVCVEVSAILVHGLHGLYNDEKFPNSESEMVRKSILHPTSREITSLLNLGVGSTHYRREHVHEMTSDGEKDQLGSPGEQSSGEILRQYGIAPPDPKYNRKRETLKNLRRSAYELMRSSILSGVTQSPSHLEMLSKSITADCQYAEPLHLVELTNKILRPLVSYPVVSVDARYLQLIGNSELPALFRVMQEHIRASRLAELLHDENPLLDVARDHGRKTLARSVADMVSSMYPRLEKKCLEFPAFMPQVFTVGGVGEELIGLWKEVCSPGRGFLDNGAARVGFDLISTAVDMAPKHCFRFFGTLLRTSFLMAIANEGLSSDSPLEHAIGAIVSVIRKWPTESDNLLRTVVQVYQNNMSAAVSECIAKIAGTDKVSSKPKKHRAAVRDLIRKIADKASVSNRRGSKVRALPEKLLTTNPGRQGNRPKNELEEIVLGDVALESLFGGGDPL